MTSFNILSPYQEFATENLNNKSTLTVTKLNDFRQRNRSLTFNNGVSCLALDTSTARSGSRAGGRRSAAELRGQETAIRGEKVAEGSAKE